MAGEKISGRTYYKNRTEAERIRRKGQTIRFSTKHRAYYIVVTSKKSFWGW